MDAQVHASIDASAPEPSLPLPYPVLSAPGMPAGSLPGTSGRPNYNILRQDEDWSFLRDPTKRTDRYDPLKFVPLNESGTVSLTLAVDSYISFRDFDNELFDAFPGRDGDFNTSFNLHASLDLSQRFRLYGALKHGNVFLRQTPALPINQNRLDLYQAFGELRIGDLLGGAAQDVIVRVGRQEIHYGSGGLISARLGLNVRSDYDGALVRVKRKRIAVDTFIYRGVQDKSGTFDDAADPTDNLWGVYGTVVGRKANVDGFYIGEHRKNGSYTISTSPITETRHTIGARLWTNGPSFKKFFFDAEAEYQFGPARAVPGSSYDIRAWNTTGVLSRTFSTVAWQPMLGLEFGADSGTRDPANGHLGTFRAPATPGRYFGEANGFGPGNIAGFRPFIELHPTKAFRLRPKVVFFWRTELLDGTYTLQPSVLRGSNGPEHFLGVEPALEYSYDFNSHWRAFGFLSHFVSGSYFDANPPNKDINYVEATLQFRL